MLSIGMNHFKKSFQTTKYVLENDANADNQDLVAKDRLIYEAKG